jgi:hypothetical protein
MPLVSEAREYVAGDAESAIRSVLIGIAMLL